MTADLSYLSDGCNSMLATLLEVERAFRENILQEELQEEHKIKLVEEDAEDYEDIEGVIFICVNYLQNADNMMLIDSGAPVSLVSSD